ncbi:MAG: phosphonate C-P lyase system protein PhnG [Cyanobacteria bacterium P01_D01_bin.105]
MAVTEQDKPKKLGFESIDQVARQRWMAVLAKASPDLLERCVGDLGPLPEYGFLRSPEIGLTMVRGRAGGIGDAFNLGEMTLTRCVVQLAGSKNATGFGYVAGRSLRHAELAAVCDALLQQPQWRDRVRSVVIEPLQAHYQQKMKEKQQHTAATQVEFFTMLRGE